MKVYKVGVIGAGNIAESNHLPVLKNLQNISVAWLYDVNSSRSMLLSNMYQVAVIQKEDLKKKIGDIDICLISTPFGARTEYYIIASALGKSVYVEKPFALTVEEHVQISGMFKPHQIAIGFQRRNYETVNELKQIIESEIFGKLLKIEFKQGNFSVKGGKGYLNNSSLSGGGILIESAIHAFDQILQFTKAVDVVVNEHHCIAINGIDYDSISHSTLILADAEISVHSEVSCLRNLMNGIELRFENATIDTQSENLTSASTSFLTTKWMQLFYDKCR
jgi:predicted dehydrogenase